MSPPPAPAGALPLGSGFSVTTASVVSSRPAMELADGAETGFRRVPCVSA